MSNGTDSNTNFGHEDGVDLKTYFNDRINGVIQLMAEKDKNYNQRFDNVVEATKSALAAADRAVSKAEIATEKRFEGVNEFRKTLSDQQVTFMPRAEIQILHDSLSEKIAKVDNRVSLIEGNKTGLSQGWGWAVGVLGIIIAVVTILLRLSQ